MKFFSCQKLLPRPLSIFSHNTTIILISIYFITTFFSIVLSYSSYVTASPLVEVPNGQQGLKPLQNPSNDQLQDFPNGQTLPQSSSLIPNAHHQARKVNLHHANSQTHASLPQSVNSDANRPYDLSDSLVETGSGNGPVRVTKHNSEKFDDTEGGDDDENDGNDENDDDYDYKETGSGLGDFSPPKKVYSLVMSGTNSETKKPQHFDEAGYYRPFRQPSVVANTSTTPTMTSTAKNFVEPPATEAPKIMTTMISSEKSYGPSYVSSEKTSNSIDNRTSSKAPARSTLLKQDSSSYFPQVSTKSEPSVTTAATTISPLGPNDNQMRVPNTTPHRPVMKPTIFPSYNPSNVSSLLKPNASKVDVDYDYDDNDTDDDESEDVSNFEDNDFTDHSMNNKTSVTNPQMTSTVSYIPPTTARPTAILSSPVSTSSKPVMTTPARIIEAITQPTMIKLPVDKENFVTTVRPGNIPTLSVTVESGKVGVNEDEEEEEASDDEEEEEDDDNEDVIEDDPEDDLDESKGSKVAGTTEVSNASSVLPPIFSTIPSRWSTPLPQLPNMRTVVNNEGIKPITSASPILELPSTPEPIYTEVQQKNRQDTITILPVKDVSLVTAQSVTIHPHLTSTLSSPVTPSPTVPTTHLYPRPTHTTVKSVSINYMTTPWNRMTPVFKSPPSISAYDKNLQDDDTGLTKQIYDKALELYEVASKAVNATVEAVWPPSFELGANTFEPLLAHPLFFMLILGAAVMGLVLTMMLVVYIFAHQIKPKDDTSLY